MHYVKTRWNKTDFDRNLYMIYIYVSTHMIKKMDSSDILLDQGGGGSVVSIKPKRNMMIQQYINQLSIYVHLPINKYTYSST